MTQSDEFNARPIGSGPMKASRGKHEIRLTAVPNAHHAAKIDTLILNEGADPWWAVSGAGFRGVYDLADPDSSVFIISTGQVSSE